jgi:hypothetical protein
MIADVSMEGAKVGLELHPNKTSIMHNGIGYGAGVRNAKIKGMDIEVLEPGAYAMYLGRALSLTDTHDAEMKYRIKKAWAEFGCYRQELTDRMIPLQLRLKLFHSVVTPSMLYGCCSWVLTSAREAALRSTEMKMMRAIAGQRRRVHQDTGEIESWVEWIRRATAEVRDAMAKHGIPDWETEQRRKMRQWQERLNSLNDHRWTSLVYEWRPSGRRSQGHPRARWADYLDYAYENR